MTDAFSIGPPGQDGEEQALATILAQTFDAPLEGIVASTERAGRENVRVVREQGRVVGGLWQLPMGHWFGGRSVPMTGIAAVGIEPASRGRGAGAALMAASVRELNEAEVALSCLYPANVPFYRAAGWELAGACQRVTMPLRGLALRERAVTCREAAPADLPAMEACYAGFAAERNGLLDRNAYIWARVRQPRGERARHYVLEAEGQVEGHLSLVHDSKGGGSYDLHLTDAVAATPRATRALLSFLGGHATLCEQVSFFGGLDHPLLFQGEWRARIVLELPWMLRLTHVGAALRERGWPIGLQTELHLDVRDEVAPGNAGRWRAVLADGRAKVERGGDGRLQTDVRGLAAVYSGLITPLQARSLGLMEGPAPDLSAASAAFAGSAPWMPDRF